MNRSNGRRAFSPVVLEQLEQRLTPAGSIFEDQVINLYRVALNRSPEPEGLQAHVQSLQSGKSLGFVAEGIFNSDERMRSVITSFYRELLNREPDTEGMEAHLRAAKNGKSEEEILATFLSSEEYVGAGVSDETFVDFLYQQVLGRAPDEQGRTAHLDALKNGATRYQVALSFVNGRETDTNQIQAFYSNLLDRTGSDEEEQAWLKRLAGQGFDARDAMVAFLTSQEGSQRIGAEILFGTDPQDHGWWFKGMGLSSLTVKPFGGPSASTEEIQKLANLIRANETFSNPDNMGQIVDLLRENDYPNTKAKNDPSGKTTGTQGASAYSEDLRNTPGAFQVDLANVGQYDPSKGNEVFGEWLGTVNTFKKPGTTDVEIAFSQATLKDYLGIEVDASGLIISIGREAASVFLGNESVAMDDGFDPLHNPLIGQHIDSLKLEQLSLYLAGRSPKDSNVSMSQDVRVAPQAVVDKALGLQYQVSKSYSYALLSKYASHPDYKETFAKAQALFGSTLQITSSQSAYGIAAGKVFWSKFNAGFIVGGGYVSGEQAMFNLFKALVAANESPTKKGVWSIPQTDKDGKPIDPINITFTKIKDGPLAGDKVFTVDKTPTNVAPTFPSIFHYGASLSVLAIDDDIDLPESWGVTGRSADLKYTRLGATQIQQGGGTLPSGAGAFSFNYQGLESSQTVKLSGAGSYYLAPVPTSGVVTVDNLGYSSNNSEVVSPGDKIDMSAYGLTIEQAYPDMYYADTTGDKIKVYHVSDKSFTPPAYGLYMYYVSGAGGDIAKATDAIVNYLVSWQEPYNHSYRVSVSSIDILGRPDNAAQFGKHFIMSSADLNQGSGVIDASGLTGSLKVATDTSITKVLLGQGANQVVAGSKGTGVLYVMNPGMAPVVDSTVFRNLRLGTDKVDLTGFGAVSGLAAKVVGSFDNKVGSSPIAKYYPQYTNTVEVSFTAGGKSYKFLVLASGKTQTPASTLVSNVLSTVVTN